MGTPSNFISPFLVTDAPFIYLVSLPTRKSFSFSPLESHPKNSTVRLPYRNLLSECHATFDHRSHESNLSQWLSLAAQFATTTL